MFTIEQWQKEGEYVIQFLLCGEPLATYKLNRKATDEELKQMLGIFTKKMGKAIDEAILYGTERGKKNAKNNC